MQAMLVVRHELGCSMSCRVAVAARSDPPIVGMATAAGFGSGSFTENGKAVTAAVVAVVVSMVSAGCCVVVWLLLPWLFVQRPCNAEFLAWRMCQSFFSCMHRIQRLLNCIC